MGRRLKLRAGSSDRSDVPVERSTGWKKLLTTAICSVSRRMIEVSEECTSHSRL